MDDQDTNEMKLGRILDVNQLVNLPKLTINSMENDERQSLIRNVCESHPTKKKWSPRGYLHSEYPFFYCKIPKVASTFMESFLPKVFQATSMKTDFIDIGELPTKYYKQEINTAVPNLFSYVFVREPYARLFSAYENKLFLPNPFWQKLGKDVIRFIRHPPTSFETGHDVKFAELLKYIVTRYKNGDILNEHLEPMHERCDPCTVNFDFIGKLETMGQDIESLIGSLQNATFLNKQVVQKSASAMASETRDAQWYGPVSKVFEISKTNPKLNRRNLFLRTWASYQIRGVILKQIEMPFKGNLKNVTLKDYRDSITAAIERSKDYKEELKRQREEALIQAYRTVPLALMQELRAFVLRDCQLFGYDDEPDKLFSRDSNYTIYFNYFKGMQI